MDLDVDINYMNEEELYGLLDEIVNETNIDEIKNIEESSAQYCSNCKTADKIVEDTERGFIVCSGCGSVLHDILDKNPEWRSYGDEGKGDSGRCSFQTNFFLPQSSLGTSIGSIGRSRIKTLQEWGGMPYRERSLHQVLKLIQSKCKEANILKCIEDDAKILYKNISECKHIKGKNVGKYIIIRGKNTKSLIAACVFFACKRKGNTMSPKEIATLFELKYTDITRGCKTFLKLIKLRKMTYDFNASTPEHFVQRFCKALNINKHYIDIVNRIAKNIQKLNIASVHTPLSIATGSILLMIDIHQLPITKKTIAAEFNVSEVTITKAFRKLEKYKSILVNDELTNKLVKMIDDENKKIQLPSHLRKRYNIIKSIDNNDQSTNQSFNEYIDDDLSSLDDLKLDIMDDDIDEYVSELSIDLYDEIESNNNKFNKLLKII